MVGFVGDKQVSVGGGEVPSCGTPAGRTGGRVRGSLSDLREGRVRADTGIPQQAARASHALLLDAPDTRRPRVASLDPRLDPTPFLRQVSLRAVSMLLATVFLDHEVHARACGLPGGGNSFPGHAGDGQLPAP